MTVKRPSVEAAATYAELCRTCLYGPAVDLLSTSEGVGSKHLAAMLAAGSVPWDAVNAANAASSQACDHHVARAAWDAARAGRSAFAAVTAVGIAARHARALGLTRAAEAAACLLALAPHHQHAEVWTLIVGGMGLLDAVAEDA